MRKLSLVLGTTILLATAASASARAVSHEVTPENIKDQPFAFCVNYKENGDAKDFEIRVGPKPTGGLPGAGENGSLSLSPCGKRKVKTPAVTITSADNVLTYTFRIPSRDLDRSIAVFTFAVPSSGDYYQISLDDFLPKEPSDEKPTPRQEPRRSQPQIDIHFRDADANEK
jgi:hypothetical protein